MPLTLKIMTSIYKQILIFKIFKKKSKIFNFSPENFDNHKAAATEIKGAAVSLLVYSNILKIT